MHVIFVEPSFPANQREFVRALHAVGASVTGVGERPVEWLDDELKGWLTNYVQIQNVTDEAQLLDAVQSIQRRGWVDRLVASIESHMLATARVREETGIPGVSGLHHVHIWQMQERAAALEAHVVIEPGAWSRADAIKAAIKQRLAETYGITHSTLELECARHACDEPQLIGHPV